MKKQLIWKILLVIGICPILYPVLSGIYMMSIESWTLLDWIALYSFVYWPTYVIGLLLIILSTHKLVKKK